MTRASALRFASNLMPLPGVAAALVAFLVSPSPHPFVVWCTDYWWLLFVAGMGFRVLLQAGARIAARART
jgi:hypothetical protein